jgi:hypothetical protein
MSDGDVPLDGRSERGGARWRMLLLPLPSRRGRRSCRARMGMSIGSRPIGEEDFVVGPVFGGDGSEAMRDLGVGGRSQMAEEVQRLASLAAGRCRRERGCDGALQGCLMLVRGELVGARRRHVAQIGAR